MAKTTSQSKGSEGYYKSWYGKNGDKLKEDRRAEYAANPEARERAKQRAREQRARRGARVKERTEMYRSVNGTSVRVFLMGDVVEVVGRTAQTIRAWEKKGWIPSDSFDEGKRLYTENQVGLIKRLSEFLDGSGDKDLEKHQVLKIVTNNWGA